MRIARMTSPRSGWSRATGAAVVLPKSFERSVGMPKDPKRMPGCPLLCCGGL